MFYFFNSLGRKHAIMEQNLRCTIHIFYQYSVQTDNIKLLYMGQKPFSSRSVSSSPLFTDAQKSHNPWGRPGLCCQGIIQVWGIMTPLSLCRSSSWALSVPGLPVWMALSMEFPPSPLHALPHLTLPALCPFLADNTSLWKP